MQIIDGIDICPPAFIYIVFSLTQIIFDLFNGLFNTAVMKFVVTVTVGFMLHLLCKSGLSIVSWVIVFIPFMLMTVIVTMLLYYFGLNSTSGNTQPTISNSYTLAGLSNAHTRGHCYSINQPYYHGISQEYCP